MIEQNRIIVTQKGQEIQQSISDEVRYEKELIEKRKSDEQNKHKSMNDESQMLLQSMFSGNSSLRMMESVSKKFQVISTSGKHAQQKLIDMFVEDNNVARENLSPYVMQQIGKMTEDIIKTNPRKNNSQSMSNLHSFSHNLDMSLHHSRQLGQLRSSESSKLFSIQRPDNNTPSVTRESNHNRSYQLNNNNNISIISNQSTLDDAFLIDKCNAIMHCEARVDRIMKRYKKYQQVTQDIDSRIQRACDRKREELMEINLKPPKRLEEIRQEHEDIEEIINRQDKMEQNKKMRVLETMKKKYQKVWRTAHVPELTEKFKMLHKMRFKEISEDLNEAEKESQSVSPSTKTNTKGSMN